MSCVVPLTCATAQAQEKNKYECASRNPSAYRTRPIGICDSCCGIDTDWCRCARGKAGNPDGVQSITDVMIGHAAPCS
jgi:hypothetical protein